MIVRVSVVVPTCRRPHLLERCLKALLTQNFSPEDYEIIVVDDAASEETKTQIGFWSQQAQHSGHHIRYIAGDNRRPCGPAAARNRGWQAANGEIIAFTDDDCVPEARWLQFALTAFSADVDGISGTIRVPLPRNPTDYEYNTAQLEHSTFATANCFYRRTALQAIGGFDERFTSACREDSDLYFTLRERGFTCIEVPTAVVVHPPRPTHWGVSVAQQRRSMFNALLYKKHPALFRRTLQPRPPWHDYFILIMLACTLIGVLIHYWLFALVAFTAWLLMTLRFCLLRLRHTSRAPSHVLEMLVTSILIPPLSIFWRLWGALKFRVFFF